MVYWPAFADGVLDWIVQLGLGVPGTPATVSLIGNGGIASAVGGATIWTAVVSTRAATAVSEANLARRRAVRRRAGVMGRRDDMAMRMVLPLPASPAVESPIDVPAVGAAGRAADGIEL